MTTLRILIGRNTKLFFKDKGLFLTALITPGILLLLYATFLGNVYEQSFLSSLPVGMTVDGGLLDGYVAAQLASSILAVSCVTVAFCSNMLMATDKAKRTVTDLAVSPVRPSVLALSYYLASLCSSLLICLSATALCMVYMAIMGWYMSVAESALLVLDVMLLVWFGTALSSIVNFFVSTQGGISAVGSLVSSCYGFLCGAYMPISQFSPGLQKVLSFLPGTYGTVLLRRHALGGVMREMERIGLPPSVVDSFEVAMDCRIEFLGNPVSVGAMYGVLGGAVLLFVGIYVLLHVKWGKRALD